MDIILTPVPVAPNRKRRMKAFAIKAKIRIKSGCFS
jgi:hypothetical protein